MEDDANVGKLREIAKDARDDIKERLEAEGFDSDRAGISVVVVQDIIPGTSDDEDDETEAAIAFAMPEELDRTEEVQMLLQGAAHVAASQGITLRTFTIPVGGEG